MSEGSLFVTVDTASPPRSFKAQRERIGKRRKRYVGSAALAGPAAAVGVVTAGLLLAATAGLLAFLLPSARLVLLIVALALAALTPLVAWLVRSRQVAKWKSAGAWFDFHEEGGIIRDPERTVLFTWDMVGRVIFRPDSERGGLSELLLSLDPSEPAVRDSGKVRIEKLRDVVVLTSERYTLAELYKIACHLHRMFGELKVSSHPLDGKLYRLD
jgi:hypothetical protein